MSDPFDSFADTTTSSSRRAFAITKSDTTDFLTDGVVPKALYIGAGGNVAVTMLDDVSVTFVAVGSGMILPIRPRKVLSTGTTAASIIGLA